jgi:hypothetical protein
VERRTERPNFAKEKVMAERQYLFDKPRNVKILLGALFCTIALLVIIDFFISKHPDFAWEGYPSFYGVYGFVACVFLVLAAKYILRTIVKRRERYYD